MGRSVIIPSGVGDSCGVCWGSGLPFGPGLTPSAVTIVFSDIIKGNLWVPGDLLPPNGSYFVSQSLPCTFSKIFSDTQVTWSIGEESFLSIVIGGSILAFIGSDIESCVLGFTSTLLPAGQKYAGGSAEIFL